MIIRQAIESDAAALAYLLDQIALMHAAKRPDIFKKGVRKYNDHEINELIKDDYNKIFVAVIEENVVGYIFTVIDQEDDPASNFTDIKNLYIDDLCVDEHYQNRGIGRALMNKVKEYAKSINCKRVTLNVWALNPSALSFYESNDFKPYKYCMEYCLD